MPIFKNPTIEEQEAIMKDFHYLRISCPNCQSEEDQNLIYEAFYFAYNAHYGVARKTGEQYITHPLEVAKIVGIELKLGVVSVICALIHDVVEDTDFGLDDVKTRFGETVANITDGLTKIEDYFGIDKSKQAENFKKLLLSINVDIRVVFIKLADRLHNMRTLHGMRENKQIEKSGEVLYLFAPLAHRLGMHDMKKELEDLSFKFRRPVEYQSMHDKIEEAAIKFQRVFDKIQPVIQSELVRFNIKYRLEINQRSCYSVWKQLQTKSLSLENVPFINSIRIVFEEQDISRENVMSWEIYGALSSIFTLSEDMFKNFVDKPRSNSYQAIHGGIKTENRKVAFQILSERMLDVALRGFAVEKNYPSIYEGKSNIERWLDSVKEALKAPDKNAGEFVEDFITSLYSSDIFVFTPKGQIRTLPKGATVLDFAYEIHSDLGNKCIGAKVNNIIRKPNYVLQGGEEVVILDVESQKPKIEWLDFVVSAKAISALKKSFRNESEKEIEEGKNIIESVFTTLNIRSYDEAYSRIKDYIPYKFKDELHFRLGNQTIKEEDIRILFKQTPDKKEIDLITPEFKHENGDEIHDTIADEKKKIDTKKVINLSDSFNVKNYKYAQCCNPLPGDEVIGSLNYNDEIVIHRTDCPTSIKITASSSIPVIKIKWNTHKVETFLTRIKVIGMDRSKLLKDIAIVISDIHNVNIKKAQIEANEGAFVGVFDLYVHSIFDLNKVRESLEGINGVERVKRVLISKNDDVV